MIHSLATAPQRNRPLVGRPGRGGLGGLSWRWTTWAGLALALSLGLGACRQPQGGRFLTPEQAGDLVILYAKAKLPLQATDIYGHRRVGKAISIHVRFSCTPQQLQSFLEASPVIPNVLQDGFRPFVRADEDIPFWRPQQLTDVRGVQTRWEREGDEVGFLLMAGKAPQEDLLTVYMLFVVEHLASR